MYEFSFARRLVFMTFLGAAITLGSQSHAAEFSDEAIALPFPPDTQNLQFVAWSGDIKLESQSPLKSLAAFYLTEMASRGWQHDDSAFEMDDDSIELTFRHEPSKVEIDLSQWSKEVRIRMDCEKVKFTDTDDPGKLAAAGIPVSPAVLYINKEVPMPQGVKEIRWDGDGCTVMTTMSVPQAFQYFSEIVKSKGFRESRRPIITETRNYTEFAKGTVEFSVNVFSHEVGSRSVLEYEDSRQRPAAPPLPAVASLPIKNAAGEPMPDQPKAVAVDATPISAAAITGSATVDYGGQKFKFPYVVVYQTKDRGDYATMVTYSQKPIPYNQLQTLVATEDDPSFGDLYEFDFPSHFIIQLGKYFR